MGDVTSRDAMLKSSTPLGKQTGDNQVTSDGIGKTMKKRIVVLDLK